MKLIRLKILQQFRSLPEKFEVHFLQKESMGSIFQFNPYCLVGPNGSGKSNVLEALASIFYHLECMNLTTLPNSFVYDAEENPTGFSSDKATVDAFELEYLFPLKDLQNSNVGNSYAHILVKKAKGHSPIVQWVNRRDFDANAGIELNGLEAKEFFPNYILGYSSGENEILSLPFFKMRFIHYDEYVQALQKQLPYVQPEGRLIYFDNGLSQAVFLTNYLMQTSDVLAPIYKTLGIKAISQFRIIIRLNELKEFSELVDEDLMNLATSEEKKRIVELTSLLANIIETLKNCSTCWDNQDGVLFLDYLVNDQTKKAFASYFDNEPIKLFQSFQILFTLNLFEVSYELKKELYESASLYVNETVPILASDSRIMRFKDLIIEKGNVGEDIYNKSLSDGEHQFLHSMGVCLLFRDSNSLFLLDEPETHFNPDWRSLFISTLKECLQKKGQSFLADILITTHSPFIVSDCNQNNVLIFNKPKGNKEKVKVTRPDFNTFGASVNLLTQRLFNKEETISKIANKRLNDILKQFKAGRITIDEAIKCVNGLGDSVEKLIIIEELKRLNVVVKKKREKNRR